MMKKNFLILFLLLSTFLSNAQKYDREYLVYQGMNVPSKLIYDQIKTYGVNKQNSGVYLPVAQINALNPVLSSYKATDYQNADLKIDIVYGPYQLADDKINAVVREEEVNKVKVKVTYYSRVVSIRFPIRYTAINGKNGSMLWNADYSNQQINTIASPEYKTEIDAYNYIENQKTTLITAKTAEIVNSFVGGQNQGLRSTYDFYPRAISQDIYKFKKWKEDDAYNEHIKNIINTYKTVTIDEDATIVYPKIKADIDYLQSYEGKFNPTDKDEDILYWGNYTNLATIYYMLDNFEKAEYYLQKLDSSKKQKADTEGLRSQINYTKSNLSKHFLKNRHYTHNPVQDYKLEGLAFTSDAASAAENVLNQMSSGKITNFDKVTFTDNSIVEGKVIYDAQKNELQFIKKDNKEIMVLTPLNILNFTVDTNSYEVHKNLTNPSNPVKQFYKVHYKSDKIKLLGYCANNLLPILELTATLRPKDTEIFFLPSLGMKKKIAKHFEDCEEVSKKAKDGDYGKGLNFDLKDFMLLCSDYDTLCK